MRDVVMNLSGRFAAMSDIAILCYRFLKTLDYTSTSIVIAWRLVHERMFWYDCHEKNYRVFLVHDPINGHHFDAAYVPIETSKSPTWNPDDLYRVGTIHDFMALVFTVFKVVDRPISLHHFCGVFGLDWEVFMQSEYDMASSLKWGIYIDNPFNYMEDVDIDKEERVLFFMIYGNYAGLAMCDVALGCESEYAPCLGADAMECFGRRCNINMDRIIYLMTVDPKKIQH